jgi:hypothetical protein
LLVPFRPLHQLTALPIRTLVRGAGLTGLVLAAAVPAPAQDAVTVQRDLPAVSLTAPPVIDGDLSDPVWQQAARADRFTDALNGDLVPDQTVAFLGYDDKSIYVAFHAIDSQPSGIVARETKRGTRFQGEDTVAFTIDPFHTHQPVDRSFFQVNPLGTQFAYLGGGRATKLEWEGKWQAAARIVADGWTVEMAIPWKILNYPAVKGPTTCGINFDRYQPRTNTRSWWSNLGMPERSERDGHWVDIRFPPFRPRLSLLPYASPGWEAKHGQSLRSGLDARATLTPSLTVVGTVNPDFRNVEGAVEGIDFSYGERFVPDRRPFFQEGSGIYEINTLVADYFYSRRIEAFDTGVNLYGKLTPRDTVGVLAALDLGHRADWLLTGRHEFGPTSSAYLALINRDDEKLTNRVVVLGGYARKGLWNVGGSWAGSWFSGGPSGDTADAFLVYRTPRWVLGVTPHVLRSGFRDELGFVPFTDYRGVRTSFRYRREWHGGPLRRFWVSGEAQDSQHYDGRLFRQQRQVSARIETHGDHLFHLEWSGGRFEQFDDSVYSIDWRARASVAFHHYGVGYAWGRRAGSRYRFLTPEVTWRFGKKLTLGLASALLHHQEDRQQHILTLNYDFSPRQGIGARVVAQNGGTNGYLAYRRSGYGGVETFLIVGDPNAQRFTRRLVFKVIWPL